MTERRTRARSSTELTTELSSTATPGIRHPRAGMADRLAARPHSREEAEERYVAARDEWTSAMRRAASGRPADVASLAIAQETYEAALAERERWANSPRVAIPIQPDRARGLEAIVGQEMIRREVHEHQGRPEPKGLRRLFRRKPKP